MYIQQSVRRIGFDFVCYRQSIVNLNKMLKSWQFLAKDLPKKWKKNSPGRYGWFFNPSWECSSTFLNLIPLGVLWKLWVIHLREYCTHFFFFGDIDSIWYILLQQRKNKHPSVKMTRNHFSNAFHLLPTNCW